MIIAAMALLTPALYLLLRPVPERSGLLRIQNALVVGKPLLLRATAALHLIALYNRAWLITLWNYVAEVPIESTAPMRGVSSIVMQSSEIQQRFDHIEQTIHQAAQACQSAAAVPMDLKDCIRQLDQKSEWARKIMQQSQDEDSIRQCVDDLEQLGDRAKDACQRAGTVDGALKSAVMQAHQELSDLKHQLH